MKQSDFVKYSTLGYQLVAGVLFFCFIGYIVDQKLKTRYGIVIGVCIGIIYCGYKIWEITRQENK